MPDNDALTNGVRVRLIDDLMVDIEDESGSDTIVLPGGTEFIWDADSTHQVINGELYYVRADEVELVSES